MCQHLRTIGDNYGLTCLDCGEVLEGYGYNVQTHTCRHVFQKYDEGYECMYCQGGNA
ncbi:hypothetical protein QYE77_14720 (plasmid) [Thermanaerothrix sp. 4228-RoL]|uniref:C2H2-type domain-containing protein n=1 Tax=Thermanaerothrix solaris TaxID=3058434 RepID=A0ABU3NSY2_9CHLR|nr:hypothetical protein [Thermanaerothrix sp. 4228-RoL]MDT8899515.1 hypothetical protein [Thermanaerothrix sp. 4228-RoL]